MPTNKPRTTIVIDDDLYKSIEEYRFSNHIKSQSQAINQLIQIGYEELVKEMSAKEKAPESDESESEAAQDPLEALTDVLGKAGWLGENGDISDADFRFLSAMLDAIRAHFE